MAFDVMIYTDCLPEASVHGGTGFQFQAESEAVTSADELFVQASMLHTVAVPLVRSGVPVTEHPQTCRYAQHQGRFYLSRGRYDGGVGDGRQGNQLTVCLVTSASADILPARPAQMFSSPSWSLEVSPTTTMVPWQTPQQIAPEFEVGALHEMVCADPWATSVLAAFLTMVEQAVAEPRRSLIIVHDNLSEAMRWVSLATLFLDPETAMKTSFAGFVENPAAAATNIVATCPSLLTSPLVAGNVPGKNVFDVLNHQATSLTPSATAALHASWFVNGDAFSALDAIEVSRRWARLMDPVVASQAAGLACTPNPTLHTADVAFAAAALEHLARAGAEDDLEAYGDALVDVVASVNPAQQQTMAPVADAISALQGAGERELTASALLAALEWSAVQPRQAWEWAQRLAVEPAPTLNPVCWPNDGRRDHAAGLLETVISCTPVQRLGEVFAWANVLETGIGPDRITAQIDALASLWAQDVTLSHAASTWLHRELVRVQLGVHLAARLAHHEDLAALAEWHSGAWDWLLPSLGSVSGGPLFPWMEGRRVMTAPAGKQLDRLHLVAPSLPSRLWAAFFSPADLSPPAELLAEWIATHPAPDDHFCAYLEKVLDGYLTTSPELLPMVLRAVPSTAVASYGPEVTRLHSQLMRLDALLLEAYARASEPKNAALRDAASAPAGLLACLPAAVTAAVCECRDVGGVAALFKVAPRGTARDVRDALWDSLLRGSTQGLSCGLRLAVARGVPQPLSEAGFRAVDSFWREQKGTKRMKSMIQALPPDATADLEEFVVLRERGSAVRGMKLAAGRILGKKD
jgi:hypothetical protein